jgi:hypothetical protein
MGIREDAGRHNDTSDQTGPPTMVAGEAPPRLGKGAGGFYEKASAFSPAVPRHTGCGDK